MSNPIVQLGVKSVLYLNTASYASPTFVAVALVGDCNVDSTWDEGESATRVSRVKSVAKTMMALSVSAKLLASLTDTSYTTIMNALVNDTVLNFMVLNGAQNQNGARGWMFDSQVFKGSEDQGLGAVVFTEIEIKPTYTGNAPNQVLVTTGAPVMTPF